MKSKNGATIPGVFVTGTGTGVGKTVVGQALLAAARRRGVKAAPYKPVETGCPTDASGRLVPEDAVALCRAAGLRIGRDVSLDQICPYRFSDPVSPHLAAEREGSEIALPGLVASFRDLEKRYGFVVAESAGGPLVPLNRRALTADLMKALNLPVVVVAPDQLGAINHTLLVIEALRRRRLKVLGVVLNRMGIHQDASQDPWGNASAIEWYGRIPVLARLGRFPRLDRTRLARAGQAILSSVSMGV